MNDFERFREMTFRDPALRSLLLAEKDAKHFAELVVKLAAERGCNLTPSEVEEAFRKARRSWLERHVR